MNEAPPPAPPEEHPPEQPVKATPRRFDRARRLLRRVGRGLGYAFFLFAVVFAILEVGVRIFAPQNLVHDVPELWEPNAELGWRRKVDTRVRANTGEREVAVCTDGRGDRISCAEAPPRTCRAHVLVIGDSFAEALSIPWEQTVWSLIEHDTSSCLHVSGSGGYGPAQYARLAEMRLSEEGIRYDLVILAFYAGNDFTTDGRTVPPPTQIQRRPFRLLPRSLSLSALKAWFYPVNQWLETWSHAYVALRRAIRKMRDPGDVGLYGVPEALRPSALTPEMISETLGAIARIHDLARAAGTPLIVTLVPFRNQALDPSGERLLNALPGLKGDLDMDLVQERFAPKLAEIEGLRVVDLLGGLRARADPALWGSRDRHFSPAGHRAWFELLRPAVREVLGLGSD